jgi:DNA invertase Pin-like site-specific DNA recombinase
MLRKGQATAILVTKLDRLTRSVKDLSILLERYFAKRYALMSVADQVDTSTAAGRLVVNVLMSVAQWEREAIGERTRDALHHKKTRGEKLGGDVPYGYQVAPNGTLHPDPHEQAMLALIRQWRGDGLSLRAITTELAAQGYLTRKRTPFQLNQVARLVTYMEAA